ncbi:MAG: LolA family protein [Dissulfurispiraceae bacterium]
MQTKVRRLRTIGQGLTGPAHHIITRSMKIVALSILVFTVTSVSISSLAFGLSAADEVSRIQKAYEAIKDISGSFIQKSYIKDLKRTDTYKGEFLIKSSRMKWEYKGDKPQAIYINGNDIIIYQKRERQAFKAAFDRATYGQAPIALLAGFGNIDKDFAVTISNNRLILRPKSPMGNISYVAVTTSNGAFPIESLTILDRLSNKIDISLKDVKINTGIKDSAFEFQPPEGVTIIQQ